MTGAGLAALGQTGAAVANAVGSGIFGSLHAKKAHQRNIAAWKMQNEYNSPRAQMQRLQEAGLNPNLIYEKGSSGQAGSVPSAPVADSPKFEFENPVTAALLAANIKQTNAQTDNLQKTLNILQQKLSQEEIKTNFLDNERSWQLQFGWDKHFDETRKRQAEADIAVERARNIVDLMTAELMNARSKYDGQELRNEYQRILNYWADIGVSPSSSWQDKMWAEYMHKAQPQIDEMRNHVYSIIRGFIPGLNKK